MIEAIVVIYVLINALMGFRYGLFRRFLHIGAFFLGLLLAQALSPGFAQMANYNTSPHPTDGHFLMFLAVLFGLVVIIEGLMFAFSNVFDAMNALLFDRFFGLVVGALAGVFEMAVVLYLFVYMTATPLPSGATHMDLVSSFQGQISGSPVAKGLNQLRPYIIVIYGPVLPPSRAATSPRRTPDPGDLEPLGAAFYARPAPLVARELLGKVLELRRPDRRLAATIVETEAYLGADDPASHSHRGATPRSRIMFGPPGVAYVYFIYGMYHCLNAVTEPEGIGSAVLVRALDPKVPGASAAEAETQEWKRSSLSGPGKLCRELGIDLGMNGWDLSRSALRILEGPAVPESQLVIGPRVGIQRAADLALRFRRG